MKRIMSIFLVLAMILTLAPMNIFAAKNNTSVFSDVDDSDYYAEAAIALAQIGILSGYPDGTFGADKTITRAEMAAIVCRMIDREADADDEKGKTDFDDVSANHWASGYINIATEEGIINGDGNGKFRPEDNVKYEEAIKMVVCALGYGEDVEINSNDWSKGYIGIAEENGISNDLKGEKGILSTRGEVALMVYNGMGIDAEDLEDDEDNEVEAPTASLAAGMYTTTQYVSLKTKTEDAVIYYTLNGKAPSVKSAKYKKSIELENSCTLRAIAVKGDAVSEEISVSYIIKRPSLSTKKYTVSFNLNYEDATGAPASQKVKKGAKATEPEKPSRENFTFMGWYTDEECTQAFDFDEEITSKKTLYAKWGKASYEMKLYASQSTVLIGEDEDTYIYLESDIEASSISLYDAKNQTNSIATLYDDGDFSKHGDDMAGDGIYSACISDIVSSDKEITFIAVYEGSKSNEVEVSYYTVLTSEEIEIMKNVDTGIKSITESEDFDEKPIEEKEDLVENKLNEFVESGEINENSISYDGDAEVFSFTFSNGVLGGVMIGEFEEEFNGPSVDSRPAVDQGISLNSVSESPDVELSLNNIGEEEFPLGEALILNAFPSFEIYSSQIAYRTNFYNTVKAEWDSKGLKTTVDTDVTVSDYQNLEGYEVICFSTHGSAYNSSVPAICLREGSSKHKDEIYSALLKNGDVAVVNGYYWILPSFFETEYGSGTLEDAFVFSECCMALGYGNGDNSGSYDYSMANAIIGASANAYIGFHNSVFADYSREFMKNYIDELIDGESSIDSYNDSISKYGSNHEIWFNNTKSYTLKEWYEEVKKVEFKPGTHVAYPVLRGDSGAYLLETGLKNGTFEKYNIFTTAPNFWEGVGDVRTLTQLGDVKPSSGSGRMAVISTGIGANSTTAIGSGTEGSIITQTFVLPKDAKEISFDYNLVSEEPMEYVGSKYNDAFAVNITCGNNTVFSNVLESVNSSTWYKVSGIDFNGGDSSVYQTNWKNKEIDVSSCAGKVVTLKFIIYDVGDSIYDSACVIDNVKIK